MVITEVPQTRRFNIEDIIENDLRCIYRCVKADLEREPRGYIGREALLHKIVEAVGTEYL